MVNIVQGIHTYKTDYLFTIQSELKLLIRSVQFEMDKDRKIIIRSHFWEIKFEFKLQLQLCPFPKKWNKL